MRSRSCAAKPRPPSPASISPTPKRSGCSRTSSATSISRCMWGAKYFDKACQMSVDPNVGGAPPTFGIGDIFAMTVGGNLIFLVAPPPAVPPASNLHLYWDSTAVVRAMQAAGSAHSEQDFAKLIAAAPPVGWETTGSPDTWAAQWASEIKPLALEAHQRLTIRKGSKPSPFSSTGGCT